MDGIQLSKPPGGGMYFPHEIRHGAKWSHRSFQLVQHPIIGHIHYLSVVIRLHSSDIVLMGGWAAGSRMPALYDAKNKSRAQDHLVKYV